MRFFIHKKKCNNKMSVVVLWTGFGRRKCRNSKISSTLNSSSYLTRANPPHILHKLRIQFTIASFLDVKSSGDAIVWTVISQCIVEFSDRRFLLTWKYQTVIVFFDVLLESETNRLCFWCLPENLFTFFSSVGQTANEFMVSWLISLTQNSATKFNRECFGTAVFLVP